MLRRRIKGLTLRLLLLTVTIAALLLMGYITQAWWTVVVLLAIFLLMVLVHDRFQSRHSILRNFPLIGRIRYMAEMIRPEIYQYFVESDTEGKPFNRRQRSMVYQRAKGVRNTVPFGTQLDMTFPGHEWVEHSMFPVEVDAEALRVKIGGSQCLKPYNSSLLNISAMSFGALSQTAIESLSQGARMGGFAMNTGEGGISKYHLVSGADLIWQIGTGYFGCRKEDGTFSPAHFQRNAAHPNVKMIELKLSQGAKPGKGGMLPAAKNTPEIAEMRNIAPFTDVISPAAHSAFNDVAGLLKFINYLRELSDGKPVGIKLCIGSKKQVEELFEAMDQTGLRPDYIAIDGAEGGTGAAPIEFSDNVGMPLHQAIPFVAGLINQYGLKNELKLIVAGKIVSAFDIMKILALGADLCYSARGMMMALGCIQALQCDSGKCPVGIATQDKYLQKGIVVTEKRVRVKNFHANTMNAVAALMGACGFENIEAIDPSKFHRRIDAKSVMSLKEIYLANQPSVTKIVCDGPVAVLSNN